MQLELLGSEIINEMLGLGERLKRCMCIQILQAWRRLNIAFRSAQSVTMFCDECNMFKPNMDVNNTFFSSYLFL